MKDIHAETRIRGTADRADFLPVSPDDMRSRGWDQCDFIIVTGDAYVDHPSFGAAVISRILEREQFRVGIISQPDWQSTEDFMKLGRPKYAFLVTAGNLDSMVAHYTAAAKPRSDDSYSPGGISGRRPDRSVIVYANRVREAYKETPVLLGGIEASLRRLGHYDYWSDRIRRSILLDAKADMIIYGMAEKSTAEVCSRLRKGIPLQDIQDVPGTVFSVKGNRKYVPEGSSDSYDQTVILPRFELTAERDKKSNRGTSAGKRAYAESVQLQIIHGNPMKPVRLIEPYASGYIVQNPPQKPLSTGEMDAVYELPYTRRAHPDYERLGGVPAAAEIQFSITANRGCCGNCSFCAIHSHQGSIIQSRSIDSIEHEARLLTSMPEFKGYIHDIGGPTANFTAPACRKQLTSGPCTEKQCLFPSQCPSMEDDHLDYLNILRRVRNISGIKKVFIRSGIRYDHLLAAPEKIRNTFMDELCRHHVSGQLRIAPEHVSSSVLDAMGKPDIHTYETFVSQFTKASRKAGLEQYAVPYFISGHPGSSLDEAVELAVYMKHHRIYAEQVQDFYPTPGTVSACMYYTELDPRPGRNFNPVYVPKGREKRLQRALLQFTRKENFKLVREALEKAGRTDLIGSRPECLIQVRISAQRKQKQQSNRRTGNRRRGNIPENKLR